MADDRFREQAKRFTDLVYSKPNGPGMVRGMKQEQWTDAIAELLQVAYGSGWDARGRFEGTDLYRLPDGKIVNIHTDVARRAMQVSFTLESGTVVQATRVMP